MKLEFTDDASKDLKYIQVFLYEAGVFNYQQIVEDIILGADNLLTFSRLGVKVVRANNPDLVRDYYYKNFCLRYLITSTHIYILRVWHQKENERNL